MDKDYIYESLDAKDLKRENNGNFAACESLWQPCSADGVKQIVSRIQDFCEFDADFLAKNKNYDGIPYSTEDYKWENVVKRLDAGKVVDGLITYVRKIIPDAPKCPTCGCSILDGGYHNLFSKKLFCSSCGARLAKELSSADGKTRIYVNSIHVTYVNKALYAYFLRETGLTDFPGWVRELADADFGIYLCDEETSSRRLFPRLFTTLSVNGFSIACVLNSICEFYEKTLKYPSWIFEGLVLYRRRCIPRWQSGLHQRPARCMCVNAERALFVAWYSQMHDELFLRSRQHNGSHFLCFGSDVVSLSVRQIHDRLDLVGECMRIVLDLNRRIEACVVRVHFVRKDFCVDAAPRRQREPGDDEK